MTAKDMAWRTRWAIPGTWAVVTAGVFGVLVALYAYAFGPPVYPVLFLVPLVLSIIPLFASTLQWAVGLRIVAWLALTYIGIVIGTSSIPCWFFLGLSIVIGVMNLRKPMAPML